MLHPCVLPALFVLEKDVMKSVYLRSGLALLCGAILSACGGSDGSLQLSGSITGLTKAGLVLENKGNGEVLDPPIAAGATGFVFTRLVSVDENFDVQVKTQPANATCVPSANQGKANVYNAYYVVITCTNVPRTLGGRVIGLKADGLVLANGPDTVTIPKPATPDEFKFVFPQTVGDGSSYGINVLTQPAGQQCTIPAGTGVGTITGGNLDAAAVVTCVDTPSAQ
jgi:hypothetical protein